MNGTSREGYSFQEFQDAAMRLAGDPPRRTPAADEILAEIVRGRIEAQVEERREREREERKREEQHAAQVQFHGHNKRYCYWVEDEFRVNDYLLIHSPWSGQDELVRVVGRGRTPEACGRELKVAKRFVTHSAGRARICPGEWAVLPGVTGRSVC
jgi:hypothetical protein